MSEEKNDIIEEPEVDKTEKPEEQTELPGTGEKSEVEKSDKTDDIAAMKAKFEKDLAETRAAAEKSLKRQIAAERKKIEDEQKVKAERAKMDEADRLKAEKAETESELAKARAELEAHQKQVALYRQMSASKLSPAAPTATPMIEAAFAAALDDVDGDAEKALAEVQRNSAFLFATAEEAEPKKKTAKPTSGPTKQGGSGPPVKREPPPKGATWDQIVAHANAQRN